MRWSIGRLSPPLLIAVLASVLILLGFIVFLFSATRPRGVEVTVDIRPTATPMTVVVTISPLPTLVGLTAPTSAPLATLPPTPTPPLTHIPEPTRPPAPTPAAPPPPAGPPAAAPPAAAPPGAAPAAGQQPGLAVPEPAPGQPPAAPAAPAQPPGAAAEKPAQPQPPAAEKPAPAPPAAAQPPVGGQPAVQPSAPGGLGNAQSDLEAAYGPPRGEVYVADRGELRATFRAGRVERIRFVLRDNSTVDLPGARSLARAFIPRDAQLVGTIGEDTPQPVDQFRSALLGSVLDRTAFRNSEPGTFAVLYTSTGQDRFSGFEIQLGL